MTVGGGRWAPVFGVPLQRSSQQGRMCSAATTNLVASDSTYDSMTVRQCGGVGFKRPYRDAVVVVVMCNTGAAGPRLSPRGPPGPIAAPANRAFLV